MAVTDIIVITDIVTFTDIIAVIDIVAVTEIIAVTARRQIFSIILIKYRIGRFFIIQMHKIILYLILIYLKLYCF